VASPDDAPGCAAIYRPIVLETAISFEWEPPSADDFRHRIATVGARFPWLVALDDLDAVAGFVHANTHRDSPSYQWSVNTSAFIREDRRGRGLGKALYRELHRRLAALGYVQAFAGVALPNAASVALHEAVGYRQLGVYEKVGFKHGQWRDVAWFQKTLQEPPTAPLAPRR
jgi:L-amino acid N-acyltransferase YncA